MSSGRITQMTGQLRRVASLQRAVQRRRAGLTVVEGPQAVRELLRYAPEYIRDVYVTDSGLHRCSDVAHDLTKVDPYTHILPDRILNQITTAAQGWASVMTIPRSPSWQDYLAQQPRLTVCCVEAQDPGNAGTIIRTADACGVSGVIMGHGSVDVWSPKVIRASAGSVFHLSVMSGAEVPSAILAAKDSGIRVLVADAHGDVTLTDAVHHAFDPRPGNSEVNLREPTMWLVGNEAHGFSPEHLALADARVSLPMWGKAESLNVAIATALCLYASSAVHHGV